MADLPALFMVRKNESGREKLFPFAQQEFAEDHLEHHLEEWVKNDVSVLGPYEVFGQQVYFGGGDLHHPDILAIDEDKNLVIIEFKRGEADKDVVFQVLTYAAWASEQTYDQMNERAVQFFQANDLRYRSLKELYDINLGNVEQAEMADMQEVDSEESIEEFVREFNRRQKIVLVAPCISDAVKRVLRYLGAHGLCVEYHEFSYYKSEKGEELISRTLTTTEERGGQGEVQRARWGEKHWSIDKIRDYVQTEFLKKVVGALEEWVQSPEEFDQAVAKLRPRIGSESAISIGGKNQIIFYYAQRWMQFYLLNRRDSELACLKDKIGDKKIIKEWQDEVAFHVDNKEDLEVVKYLIKKRYQAVIA